ncbi:MAG TPA: hypothetical protein ENH13_02040 [Euryarchaeota archaeon]|nr:hypothetical protein BMS3Bbin16_00035 [archaeon BMS3Bbin16]HDH27896.1 hypothetical protein [Euryarchaeota archaeon]
MAELTVNDILELINIFLGFLLALLAVRYMRFYSQLSEWWRRLLLLTFIFILDKVVSFMDFEVTGIDFAIVMDTIFIGYFIYFLSYITHVVRDIDSAKSEMAQLKRRLSEIKLEEGE